MTWQYNFVLIFKICVRIEAVKGSTFWGKFKWFRTKIESTLLKGHTRSCRKESIPFRRIEIVVRLGLKEFRKVKERYNAYLALPKTCFKTPPSTPSRLKMTSCASKSSRHPKIDPPRRIFYG